MRNDGDHASLLLGVAARGPARRRAPRSRQSRPTPRRASTAGVTHLREGPRRAGARGVQEGDQARTPRTPTSTRAWASPTRAQAASATTRSRPSGKALELNPYYVDVRNDLGTALIALGQARGGQDGVPGRLQRPHQPHARDLGAQPGPGLPRGEELRRGRQLVPHAASTATRPTPTPTSAWRTRSWPRASPRRRSCQLEAGVKEIPGDAAAAARAGRGATTGPAASREARARLEEVRAQGPRRAASGARAAELLKHLPEVGLGPLALPAASSSELLALGARAREARCCSTPRARSWSAAGDARRAAPPDRRLPGDRARHARAAPASALRRRRGAVARLRATTGGTVIAARRSRTATTSSSRSAPRRARGPRRAPVRASARHAHRTRSSEMAPTFLDRLRKGLAPHARHPRTPTSRTSCAAAGRSSPRTSTRSRRR